jgi:hypothetical protein
MDPDGDASSPRLVRVGEVADEERAAPQELQKRLLSSTSAEQDGQ